MKNKKGVSIIIGYVLLIIIGLSLSLMVYNWMKKKIPVQSIECPDGVSVIILNYNCDSTNDVLNITLQNNGLFDLTAISIRAAKNKSRLAIYNISLMPTREASQQGDLILFDIGGYGGLKASGSEKITLKFSYNGLGKIEKVEIIPIYLDKEKLKTVVCANRRIEQELLGCN